MRIFTDPSVEEYSLPGHPEAPWRVRLTAERLRANGWMVEQPHMRARVEDVLRVHTQAHWRALSLGLFEDPDTPYFDGIGEIALLSASGALSAARSAMDGTPAFSLMRPPGHHAASERIAGFCYLNNIAIACAMAESLGERIAILDVDVHHGDGTEAIARLNPNWFFVSLHQAPLYPGTGMHSEERIRNFPLPPETEAPAYLEALSRALDSIASARPTLLAVSAGFDTYRECPLAQMRLEPETYETVGHMIARTGLRRFAVLEGGYARALPELVHNFLKSFGG